MKDSDLVKVLSESMTVAVALDRTHRELADMTRRVIDADRTISEERDRCEDLERALDDACVQRDMYQASLAAGERQAALAVNVGNLRSLAIATSVQIVKAMQIANAIGGFSDGERDGVLALERAAAHVQALSDLLDAVADDTQKETESAVFAGEAAQRDQWIANWDADEGVSGG